MNVYQMYHENDCQFGFYVVKYSWKTIIAKITGIEGVEEGKEIEGIPPYYGNPNPKVFCELYRLNENSYFFNMSDEVLIDCNIWNPLRFIEVNELSCPGTYSYSMIRIGDFKN